MSSDDVSAAAGQQEQQQQESESGSPQLHPLTSVWSLWYMPEIPRAAPGSPQVDMNTLLRKVDTFNTVEGFWSIYNALPGADTLQMGEQFMFFREPTRPVWEDPTLQDGEMFSIFTDHVDAADTFIQRFLMAIMGESVTRDQFKNRRNLVAGFRYSPRRSGLKGRSFKIDIWTTDCSPEMHIAVEACIIAMATSSGIRNIQPPLMAKPFVKK